ncbi:ATP-binding protein [Ferrimicrobium acidiphilum]|uniref:ATP-binding protein n=1 Tax=Ferrimicrobium acidiphilum TaxID=121039 RepID=UPI003C6D6F02
MHAQFPRYTNGLRSTILTSQLPVVNWYASIGDTTIADALLDHLTTNLHRNELNGESILGSCARCYRFGGSQAT